MYGKDFDFMRWIPWIFAAAAAVPAVLLGLGIGWLVRGE